MISLFFEDKVNPYQELSQVSEEKKEAPYNLDAEDNANWISTLLISWLTPLLEVGIKEPLKEECIMKIKSSMEAKPNFTAFHEIWEQEKLTSRYFSTFLPLSE